jgi:flagellar hook-associated protein FlgK
MGITSAFSISRSGLSLVEKRAEITASNIANAERPDYTRKVRDPGLGCCGGRAHCRRASRESTFAVERLHRIELSRAGRQDAIASGLELYSTRLGQPGATSRLPNRMDELRAAFNQLGQLARAASRADRRV